MKKFIINLLLVLLAVPVLNAANNGKVTLTTTAEVGTKIKFLAWTSSVDDAVTVDWGDGNAKSYNIEPGESNLWSKWIETTVAEGQKLTITGTLQFFKFYDGYNITSAVFENQSAITKLDLSKNDLTEFSTEGMTSLTELNLSENKLTSFSLASDVTSLKVLNLSKNQIDSHSFDISAAGGSLKELNVSGNGDNFVTLNLMSFPVIEEFNGDDNPELTTVVFADAADNLKRISMNNCYIMHFYARTMPSLTSLYLSGNALLELEAGSYPALKNLSISNNYLTELDVTAFPLLEQLYCGSNKLTTLNVSSCPELTHLSCGKNQITSLDITNNKLLTSIDVNGNPIKKLDITGHNYIYTINISDTPIKYIDLTDTYSLRNFYASNTQCPFFYFNYVNPWGRFNTIDITNNSKMTGNSMTFTLRTLPAPYSEYTNSLKIAGSNGETADTSYATEGDLKWKIDVNGDGTATCPAVPVTINATDTGEKVTVTGEYGGMKDDQTFEFTKYSTTGGTFTVSQWSGSYFQQLADVTTSAKAGVGIHITATPDEGYVYDSVTVNGETIDEEWFVVNEESTITVNFRKAEGSISFTTGIGQALSFQVSASGNNPKVDIDWGNGARNEYTLQKGKLVRIDGTAADSGDSSRTDTTVKIYGDVTGLNLESYGEYGESLGIWNNKVTGIDLSGINTLTYLNLYMNPIETLDVSGQADLEELDASYCELKTINVTNNSKLVSLYCYGNELVDIDLSKCPELVEFNARVNDIEEIDFSHNTKLQIVNVVNNWLDEIDVTMLPKLLSLEVSGNYLTSIDLSKNTNLMELGVNDNALSTLDISKSPKMRYLSFNKNSIKSLDLSKFTDLRQIDCGGNGMTACELNDFYMTLPKYPTLSEDEQIIGSTLTLLTGTEPRPNDAEGSDTSIATEKGWITSATGNASGCDVTILTINSTVNGTIVLKDVDGQVIKSGDKVKRNSDITVEATPAEGYELDKITVNGREIEGLTFTVSRPSTVIATFKKQGSVSEITIDGVDVAGAEQSILVAADKVAKVAVYDMNGRSVYAAEINDNVVIPMATGYYAVRIETADGTMSRVVSVK